MPTLGSSTGLGVSKRGIWIPAGSLDIWRAARDAHASTRPEVAIFGDSTTFGSADATMGPAYYSWTQKLRALSIGAGYTDGGRGIAGLNDTAYLSGENLPVVQSRSGFGSNASVGLLTTDTPRSVTAGETVTFQGYGTTCRLHYVTSTNPVAGRFTYSIDGAAAVTVDAGLNAPVEGARPLLLSLGTSGLHTVTVTNLGGTALVGPTITVPFAGSGGSLAAGIYGYRVTGISASGETTAGPSTSVNVAASGKATLPIPNTAYFTSFKVYRGFSNPYDYLGTIAASGSTGNTSFVDDGTSTPNAAIHPPATSTAGFTTNADAQAAAVTPEFMNTNGIVYHKQAVSGIAYQTFFNTVLPALYNYASAAGMGLDLTATPPTGHTYGWALPSGTKPLSRNVKLAISALGVNNMGDTPPYDNVIEGVQLFARMARAAGADPFIVVPHMQLGTLPHDHYGRLAQAITSAARAMSCPYVDFNEALGPIQTMIGAGRSLNLHANDVAYDAEAMFLWQNALAL